MPKIRPWEVVPGNKLEKFESNFWAVSGHVPGNAGLPRRMGIVKRSDGKLLFINGIPVDDATLAEIRAFGEPAYLVVPHAFHVIDGPAFQEKLGLKLYCPAGQVEGVAKRGCKVEGPIEALPPDPSHVIEQTEGLKNCDPMVLVKTGGKVTLYIDDAFSNIQKAPFMMTLMGFGGGPKIPRLVKLFFTKDKKALRGHLERIAATPGLSRVVPCHGDVIESDAAGALSRAAATL